MIGSMATEGLIPVFECKWVPDLCRDTHFPMEAEYLKVFVLCPKGFYIHQTSTEKMYLSITIWKIHFKKILEGFITNCKKLAEYLPLARTEKILRKLTSYVSSDTPQIQKQKGEHITKTAQLFAELCWDLARKR